MLCRGVSGLIRGSIGQPYWDLLTDKYDQNQALSDYLVPVFMANPVEFRLTSH